MTALAENGTLPRAHCVSDGCETVLKLLRREPWRSIALLGSAGTGKSALMNQLVYELAKPENAGWRVLRISPTDFMAGTKYLGEWETKVRDLVEAIKKPRRVVLYVPNLCDLSAAGKWSKSDMNVASALAPYLEEGTVLLVGESAPEEFERGIREDVIDGLLGHGAEGVRPVLACIVETVSGHDRKLLDELERLVKEKKRELRHKTD